jgi:hypothetical protein
MKEKLFLATIAAILLTSCGDKTIKSIIRIENVERVLENERGHYVLYARHDSHYMLDRYEICVKPSTDYSACYVPAKMVTDVAKNEPMWAEVGLFYESDRVTPENWTNAGNLIIHLHTAKEINGGGWDHGKFGNGQTTVVE